MTSKPEKSGCVTLVGAGPGDPGLITVAGLARLQAAHAVVYDALANPALLAHAPDHAQLIDVGKRAGHHKLTQDQINQTLLDQARLGRRVVRLKGGDPYLFGRGAEEVAFLARHGVACEVIPGITAGIAAPATAGIPVTHRACASSVTFVTGHEDPAKADSSVDYAALAGLIAAGGAACFYMGVGRLTAIRDALLAAGLSAATPAALIQWGTLPTQRSVRGQLASIVEQVQRAGLGSPAIIVVGAVAGLDEPGLDFFTARPLFGQTVLVTRTRKQASTLRDQLEGLGAQVLEAPTIQVVPAPDAAGVDAVLGRLDQFDWLVLTSVNGVEALADRLFEIGRDSRSLASLKVAAVGPATAQALRRRLGVAADLVPPRFVAESLAQELTRRRDPAAGPILLVRADIGRPDLPDLLRRAGATVTDLAIYETRPASALPDEVVQALRDRRVDWAAFTSASTARNLVELLGAERHLLRHLRTASIGPITSAAMREHGLTPAVEASTATIDALTQAIAAANL